MPRVWNKREPGIPADAVYVGRPSPWGNPFGMAREEDRADVIARYREYLATMNSVARSALLAPLHGKDLVCWCAPKPCHADVILELLREM